MDDDDISEMRALVVGFLTQSLKENPNGFSVQEFERFFPERSDEPHDWYKRYKKKTTLEALECIQDAVSVSYNSRYNTTFISLIMTSDKVDTHLIDLITNQRSSSKKKNRFSRPSSRALASFSLNRQYSNHHSRNNYHSRLNHDQQYRGENLFIKKDSPPVPPFRTSIYNKTQNAQKMASGDPRNRGSVVPTQVRSTQYSYPKPPSAFIPISKPLPQISRQTIPKVTPSKSVIESTFEEKEEDPVLVQKKTYLRQRILSLLTRKFSEIKLLYLNSLYELEFEESIDTLALGHQNLTSLMQDPLLSPYIQINYKSYITISARNRSQVTGKENNVLGGNNKQSDVIDFKESNNNFVAEKSNTISSTKAKLDAIDPFNVRTMLQSLEPIGTVKEPLLYKFEIDGAVKYKTMRIIFKSPDQTLKLEDWEMKFEQESRLKIRIRDYGFKTLLEFFKQLAKELPINIRLNKHDEWVAAADLSLLSQWIHEKLLEGHYRAITAIEVRYELIAFPGDNYTYTSAKDLMSQEYHPAFILSLKRSNSIWIQLRTSRRIEDHLCVEASMVCYEDYKEKNLLTAPKYFIKPGFPCAVFDGTQQRWCRALILKAPEIIDRNYEITALLVDYAIIRNYAISQLSCLMKTHLKLPVGPVYSRLHGIRNEGSLTVQQHAKMILQEYTSPPVTLACKFLSAVPSSEPDYLPRSCFEVTLVDTRHGKDCNLADDINNYQVEE